MNICVITTFDCSFEEFKAMVGEFEKEMQKCVSEWEIAKINDHKAVGLMNVTDMEMFTAMMSSPEAAEVDAKYNIVDTIYSMDKISQPAFRPAMDDFSYTKNTAMLIEKLASTNPTTFACMHGSAWSGDRASLLRELCKTLTE